MIFKFSIDIRCMIVVIWLRELLELRIDNTWADVAHVGYFDLASRHMPVPHKPSGINPGRLKAHIPGPIKKNSKPA